MERAGFEDKGVVVRVDVDRHLAFSHWSPLTGADDLPDNYHFVAIDLDPDGEGTTVTLTQSNLVGGITDADRASRPELERTWAAVLEGLRQTVMAHE